MLHEIGSPFITLYQTAAEWLQAQTISTLSQIIFNPQMKLIFEVGANWCCENLPTANKVAVIIPDEYENSSCCNIILADHRPPSKPLCYYCISPTYATYMLLHYVLLFPYGDCGWHWGMQLYSNSCTRQHDWLPQQAYFWFYLYVCNGFELVLFAFCWLFQ